MHSDRQREAKKKRWQGSVEVVAPAIFSGQLLLKDGLSGGRGVKRLDTVHLTMLLPIFLYSRRASSLINFSPYFIPVFFFYDSYFLFIFAGIRNCTVKSFPQLESWAPAVENPGKGNILEQIYL